LCAYFSLVSILFACLAKLEAIYADFACI